MTLPTADTVVTYPAGDTRSEGTVLHVEPLTDGRSAVVLDRTAAHPIDTAWPDQPADRAFLRSAQDVWGVSDVVTGGVHEGELLLGTDLSVRTGTEGWVFVVAHIVEGAAPAVGSAVSVEVDADYRAALSAGHTACHLAALALDATLADQWTKPAPTDALGNPAFDSLAIQTSRIVEHGSVDVYRLGKSLRRKGFPADGFSDLDRITTSVNERLAKWIASAGSVTVLAEAPGLSDRRSWECELPGVRASIPCGGTHARSLSELGSVTVKFETAEADKATEVTMSTTVGNTRK